MDARLTTGPMAIRPLSRRSILAGGLLGGAATALGACSTSLSPVKLPKGPDILIGANLEMTGVYSAIGSASWDAINIVANSLNNRGVIVDGHVCTVKVLPVLDNKSDPKQALANMQTLVGTPGLTAVVGAVAGADSEAMSPLAEQHSVLMLSLSTDTSIPATLMPGRPQFVFLLGPSSLDVTVVLLSLVDHFQVQKLVLVRTDDTYGRDGEEAIFNLGSKMLLNSLSAPDPTGGRNAIVTVDPAGTSPAAYKQAAEKVVGFAPYSVIIWGLGPVAGNMSQALRSAGFRGRLFFDPGAASDETITGANHAAVDGAYLVAPSILAGPPFAATTPAAVDRQNFFNSYTLKHPIFSGLAVYGGDAVNLVAQAAIKAKSTDPLAIRKALTGLTYEGIAGTYSFAASNSGALTADSLTVFEITNGGWELFPFTPES